MKNYPNMMIIRGNGRNVGKTFTACRIISDLAMVHPPVAVKISSHFHPLSPVMDVICESADFVVAEERSLSGKDSSRMLQAGARRVFYIQTRKDHVLKAFRLIEPYLDPQEPVVVESGGLYDFVEPSVLVQIMGEGSKTTPDIRPGTNSIILTSDEALAGSWIPVRFMNHKFEKNV